MDVNKALLQLASMGYCPALIFDDNGKWCVTCDGMQPCDWPLNYSEFWFDEETQWRDTPEDALKDYFDKIGILYIS